MFWSVLWPASLPYVLFCNPTRKTETATANRWGTTNSKPPGPIIICRANQKHWAAVRSYLLHSFLQVHTRGNASIYAEPKPFSWAKPAHVGFSSSNVTVQDHILITVGDALTSYVPIHSCDCRHWAVQKYCLLLFFSFPWLSFCPSKMRLVLPNKSWCCTNTDFGSCYAQFGL